MSQRLIGQDCQIYIYDGGPSRYAEPDGLSAETPPPPWAGVVANAAGISAEIDGLPFIGIANSIKINDTANVVDVHAGQDQDAEYRATYGETSITVDMRVVKGGYVAITEGHYGLIKFRSISGATLLLYEGIWTSLEGSSSADNPQSQVYVLECDANL
jgi:hypothetical protein